MNQHSATHEQIYRNLFEGCVYAAIGGLDMAEEFFKKHEPLRERLQEAITYHFVKGHGLYFGADKWIHQIVRPILRQEFIRATGETDV